MTIASTAALIVDDNWYTADGMRQELEAAGIVNVSIACSLRMVMQVKQQRELSFVCMPEHIVQDWHHPLNQPVLRELSSIPVVSYGPGLSREWLSKLPPYSAGLASWPV